MDENAKHDELLVAMKRAYEYGHRSVNSQRVVKAFKSGRRMVYHRVNTPAPDKQPVLYIYAMFQGTIFCRTFLVVDGWDGESFVGGVDDGHTFQVVHGHAIRRYIERRNFQGTLEQAQRKILTDLIVNDVEFDGTDDTLYLYYDGGVFLCTQDEGVIHLRTFIMNRQCSPKQRMKSLRSEKETLEFKRALGTDY